jgi:hypothetical protein
LISLDEGIPLAEPLDEYLSMRKVSSQKHKKGNKKGAIRQGKKGRKGEDRGHASNEPHRSLDASMAFAPFFLAPFFPSNPADLIGGSFGFLLAPQVRVARSNSNLKHDLSYDC